MVSKYDIHWARVKQGHYVMAPNNNYEVRKNKDGWTVLWHDLMYGRKRILAQRIPTYAEAKRIAERDKQMKLDYAIRRLGR